MPLYGSGKALAPCRRRGCRAVSSSEAVRCGCVATTELRSVPVGQMVEVGRVTWSAMTTVTEPLTPDDIDLAFVAQVVPELEIATIGEEQVVIGGATQLVVLNPTAALIFQFL